MMNSVLLLVIGVCLGIILHYSYLSNLCKNTATLKIDTTDEKTDTYVFDVNIPLESLSKYKMILVKVEYNKESKKEE